MATAPEYVWFILAGIGFAAALAVLGILAAAVRDEVAQHDLRLKVSSLRATLPSDDDADVIEVGELPTAPPTEPVPEQAQAA